MRSEFAVYRALVRAKARGVRPSAEELAAEYERMTGRHITTGALTARVRDLRARFGEARIPYAQRDELGVYRYEVVSAVDVETMGAARNRIENGPGASA